MSFFRKLAVVLVIIGGFSGCRKNFETDWDVDLVAPIARSDLKIKNFFSDSLFQADNGNVLHLAFSKALAGFKLDTLIKIPDTLITDSFLVIPGYVVVPGQPLIGFPNTQDINFNVNGGVELRRVIIHDGTLKIKYTNTFTQPLSFSLTLTTAIRNGLPFTINETINPGSVGLIKYYDLDGYDISLTGSNGNKSNDLVQVVTISTPPYAKADTTKAGQRLRADISYTRLVPEYVEGYFGQQTIDIKYDSTALNLNKNLEVGNLKLSSASINFRILNEFGVDVNAQLSNIRSVNSHSNIAVLLNAPGISNININRAGKTSNLSNPVFPSVKTISVNTSNSNLKPFLENIPDYLTYQGQVLVNPLGNISGSNDFAYLNTGITIFADVDIPLQLQADYFKLTTTTPLDLTSVNQLDNINYGNIIIQATNGFPFDAVLQGYVLNDQQQVIDSLFDNTANTIHRGIINANNDVTQSVYTKLLVPFTESKLRNLKKCKNIKFVSRFNMPPTPPDIKIYDYYDLNLILSVDVNYKVKKK
ncbi:MAG: hypothetical protein ACXVPQ_01280 [Bacteroidia bacterium]